MSLTISPKSVKGQKSSQILLFPKEEKTCGHFSHFLENSRSGAEFLVPETIGKDKVALHGMDSV